MSETGRLEVYTLQDVTELLKITRRTAYKYISNGALQGFKVGREWRFTRAQVEEFISSREKNIPAE